MLAPARSPTTAARRSPPSLGISTRVSIPWLIAITIPDAARDAPTARVDQPNFSIV